MYNVDNPPKSSNIIEQNGNPFRLPHHIHKLATKLINLSIKENLEKTLKMFSSLIKQDPILKEIFILFKWREIDKNFEEKVNYEDFINELEIRYEFNRKELIDENINLNKIESNEILGNDSNKNQIQNINSNISLFKNDSNDMFFYVQKPIPLNSLGDRNLMMQETHLDLFLTNSAKVGWNHNEDDNSLISNWQKSSSNKIITKTPSFHHEEMGIEKDENQSNTGNFGKFLSNNSQKGNTFNTAKSNFNNYGEYMTHLKPGKESVTNIINNSGNYKISNNINIVNNSSSFYGKSFRPYVGQNLIFPNQMQIPKMPYNLYSGELNNTHVPIYNNISVSDFKIDNIPLNEDNNTSDEETFKKRKRKRVATNKNENQIKYDKNDKNTYNRNISKKTNLRNKSKINKKEKILKKVLTKNKNKISKIPPPPIRSSNFGLKEISKQVKDIVRKFKKTSYKQISDLIVNEINQKDTKDEKNVRRRIYDSLNVMKAMSLFKKSIGNKYIEWNTNCQDNDYSSVDDDQSFNKKENSSIEDENFNIKNKSKNFININYDENELNEKKNLIVD